MGAAKTISQGNPPSDDTMQKYMRYQQKKAAGQGNPAENLSRKIGAFNRGESPEMRSGINLDPGRANRTPEQGSREYEQLLQQVRRRNKGRR